MKTVQYTIWKRDGNSSEQYIAPGYKEEYDTYEEAKEAFKSIEPQEADERPSRTKYHVFRYMATAEFTLMKSTKDEEDPTQDEIEAIETVSVARIDGEAHNKELYLEDIENHRKEEAELWDAEASYIKRDFPINNLED